MMTLHDNRCPTKIFNLSFKSAYTNNSKILPSSLNLVHLYGVSAETPAR